MVGIKYKGLNKFIQGSQTIGYFTDKNIESIDTLTDFGHAQYMLAPHILDLNNTDHKYIIFDCSLPIVANRKIREINATAWKKNKFGVILARKP